MVVFAGQDRRRSRVYLRLMVRELARRAGG
jgi:hypothetical protein